MVVDAAVDVMEGDGGRGVVVAVVVVECREGG
jgi:hypothetical protein